MDERDLTVQKKAHCKAGKRVLSAIMVLAMLCTMMCGTTVPVTASSSGMTLAQLQAKFPEGKYWNGGNADRYTSYACTCHNQGICIDDIDPCNCNHFQGGTQCNGFARKLAYDAYGSHLSTWQTTSSSSYVDALKPGDVVYNDSPHWFMVISVSSDSVTVGECNWGSRCVIEWSRTVKKSTIKGYDGLNIFIAPYALPGGSSSTSAPVVTEITASAKYAKVGDSVTFSFPAYNATKYELVITNTTTGERIQYTMLDSSSFTQIFWSEGLHLVQVNAYGTEIVGFDNFYFEVHSGNRPNTYVGGKNEDWCFTPQELTILHDAPMQERIVEAVLNYYKDGTLWYTGSIIDTGLYTTYFYPGAYEGNILLTYESGYSVYTKTRCWYVGEKPSGAVITASSTMPKVGDMVTFTLNATGGTEHCIYIGDGNEEIFKSLTSSCTYQFTKAGTYYVYGWTRNAYGENYPEAVTITVGEEPSGAVITASSTAPKVGDTVTFTLNATGGTEYCICIGNGDTEIFKDLTNSSTYQFTKAGTYYIYGWTRNAYGTTYPDTVTLIVEDNTVSVNSVSLNKTSATIDVGDTLNLTATVAPSNATNKAVTWTSSNPSVATVTNGTVTALKTGTVTIIATTEDGSKTATCVVTVNETSVVDANFNGAIKVGTAKVDGILDEAYKSSFSIKNLGVAENAFGTEWPGTCYADVYFLYDDANLYICAKVEDDDVLTMGKAFATGDNPYQNDNIEFLLSLDGTTETIKVAVDAYGYACYGRVADYDRIDYSTIKYATKITDVGYYVEVAIPCTNGNLNMIKAGKLGFAYQLNDINVNGRHFNHTQSYYGEAILQPVFVALSSEQALKTPVTLVSLNKTSTTLKVGATETLTATVAPTNATNKAVTWTSSNPQIASVSNGVVTAKAAGTTTIIATTVDGSKTATCVVTVNEVNEDMPSLKINDITVRPGESFYVDIVAENCGSIKAITVNDIEYSQSLTLTNAEWLLSGSTLSSIDINGDSLIAFQSAVDANKAVMRLYFTVDSGATDEDAYIHYKALGTDSSNKNFDFVEYDGTVTIRSFIIGDCDGDEVITVDDAIYLAFYTFYPDRYPIPEGMNVDFDKDGEVTVDDAIYLAFYTFYPDRYPLN